MQIHRVLTLLVAASAIALTIATSSEAAVIGGPIVNPANGHRYYLLSEQSWNNSEAEAVSLGGHLVTINNQVEDDFVWSQFGPASSFGSIQFWIGLNDAAVDGTFVWSSGETPSYTNWTPGEPSGTSGGAEEDYVIKWGEHDGQWNDGVGSDLFRGVVEVATGSELLPAWTCVGSACTVDEDSLGKFEFANADFKFRGTNVSSTVAQSGALVPITARCNVTNPLDTDNPDWNRLFVGYQDTNGTNSQNGVVVRLKRINRPSGTVFDVATFNSNLQNTTNRTEKSITLNHDWNFLANEYFLQIELTRGSINNSATVFSLRLTTMN